ncbi:hypothetical protein RclHR1_00700009 [Rhizophagus clarus]|uniref:Uncharacterized protein n=1 Tax=Rhizophagus clarus TaxID=94130 RepID=A0A2Z6SAL2_9GLOM|nr:hypothetical protein RclHR1_00700009 [Rhizophagus clarus]GES99816.1 hypothetical protein GLOIN_2v1774987 [Rhizophagus clarus]
MTFVPVIEAYQVSVKLDMAAGACRIWIEDVNHCRIAGDGKGSYHACDGSDNNQFEVIDFNDQEYFVVAKVNLSGRDEKVRGSFNGGTCFRIHGNSASFYFDQTTC